MTSIGRYQIVQKLGQGGMGAVYQAFDPTIQRTVAIKVISSHTVDRPDLRERFFREARAAGQLTHKNIITIYDLGEHEGQPYIAMEFLEGRDLDWHMRHGEPLSLAQKLDIIAEIAEGLAYAHERGIVHRDVKPANIMLAGDRVKILDFGLARVVSSDLTRSNMMFGTMEYMAPEQIRAEPVDHRADIFSVGALFYELLTGRRPFQGDTFASTMYKILQEVPIPLRELAPDLPPHVCAIVERALSKSRSERYQTMTEMLRAVRLARQSIGSTAFEVSPAMAGHVSPPPMTPPDAPTFAVERPSGRPGEPAWPSPVPAATGSGSALSRLPFGRRTWLGAAVAGLLLLAALGYWVLRPAPAPASEAPRAAASPPEAGTSPGPGPADQPSNPVAEPGETGDAPDAAPDPDSQGAVKPPAPPAAPAPPDRNAAREDTEARRSADVALRQMGDARQQAEGANASELAREELAGAQAREREARRLHARGEFLRAQAAAYDARAQYLLATTEARQRSEALAAEAREAAARQAAQNRVDAARREWDQARQAAERAGAGSVAALGQANTRASAARQAADRGDLTAAIAAYAEATKLAERARNEAAARAAEASKAPAPRPAAPAPDPASVARGEIEELLGRYLAALRAHDLAALKRVWPSLAGEPERAIRDEFSNARAIEVTMASPRIEVEGDGGRVTARRDYVVQTRDGQRLQSATQTTLQVKRVNQRWVIDSIRHEPLR